MVVPPENEEVPRAHVKRIVKAKLSELCKLHFNEDRDIPVQKEALQAFAESTRIFIHYLSATANDICRESKRQTINGEDVLKALEELEFKELVEPLRYSLEGFKVVKSKKNAPASKRKATPSSNKSKVKVRNVVEIQRNTEDFEDEEDDTMQY